MGATTASVSSLKARLVKFRLPGVAQNPKEHHSQIQPKPIGGIEPWMDGGNEPHGEGQNTKQKFMNGIWA